MVPESHKWIAKEIYKHFEEEYSLQLDKNKLLWGSIAPDIMPKYKLIRHYKSESILYVASQITKVILTLSLLDEEGIANPIKMAKLSKRIGVISHYLTDYTTHPHARRITCTTRKGLKDHFAYEAKLNESIKNHSVDFSIKQNWDFSAFEGDWIDLRNYIMDKIHNVVEEYMALPITVETDINYAVNLNLFIVDLIFEAVYALEKDTQLQMI